MSTIVEYVFPNVFLVAINIALCRKLHALSVRSKVSPGRNNALNANLRAAKSRGTFVIILIIFAFITPNAFHHGYVAYRMLTKSQTSALITLSAVRTAQLSFLTVPLILQLTSCK